MAGIEWAGHCVLAFGRYSVFTNGVSEEAAGVHIATLTTWRYL
jgi:hypothetical protein